MSESHVGLWSPPSHDRRSALELVAQLAESSTEDELRRATQCFFFDYFGADVATYDVADAQTGTFEAHVYPLDSPLAPLAKEDTLAVLADSPAARHIPRWTDLRPLRMSDLADRFTFERTETYQVLFRPFGYRYQMLIPINRCGSRGAGYVVTRAARDFEDRWVSLATYLQPVLIALHGAIRTRTRGPQSPEPWVLDRLTRREGEVVTLIADGLTAVAVGRALGISPHTVRKHAENAYAKLGVRDRVSLVRLLSDPATAPCPPGSAVRGR